MIVIGVTGGVGCGKSTVLDYLETHYGARILRADDAAKDLQKPGGTCYDKVLNILHAAGGEEELTQPDGAILKDAMARIIFRDPEVLEKIEAVVHPAVHDYILDEIHAEAERGEKELFILEAALLIECGYRSDVDEMWYVYCDEAVRRERLKASRGYSDEKITSIMASQLTDRQFREGSDEVIDNSGAPEKTHRQVDLLVRRVRERRTAD